MSQQVFLDNCSIKGVYMPVNYQQALQQIRAMGKQAPMLEEQLRAKRAEAAAYLSKMSCELDTLEQLVERASAENDHLRCAVPRSECLAATFPTPLLPACYSLLAADGSQINPDRHGSVEFGAINVGAIRVRAGSGTPPQEFVRSQLMFHDALYSENGSPLDDDVVALMRDLAERQELVEMARSEPPPVVTLTDGGLELFRQGRGMPEFDKEFEKYQGVLEQLAELQVATAGYVDKPRGDLVVRLLELVILAREGELAEAGRKRPLRFITDISLYQSVLRPGERSAVFGIRTAAGQGFKGRLEVHFFYLNVGRENHAYLSRVEIPRFVAENPALIDLLHATLVTQAHHLGARPYPYILHRAHEIAVVSFEERDQLEAMIVSELRRQGVAVEDPSNKQVAKDSSNMRTR
jgi:hypothetical protein